MTKTLNGHYDHFHFHHQQIDHHDSPHRLPRMTMAAATATISDVTTISMIAVTNDDDDDDDTTVATTTISTTTAISISATNTLSTTIR